MHPANEAILTYGHVQKSAGTNISANAVRPPWTVESVPPGAKVISQEARPSAHHKLEIPRLPAEETCKVAAYTFSCFTVMKTKDESEPFTPAQNPDCCFPDNHIMFFLDGSYQFLL